MIYQLIKLNSARNCLKYIIKAFNIREINLPYYLCPVIRNIVFKEQCKIKFYHINEDFTPVKEFKQDEFILYPNYFGICSEIIENLSKRYRNLIIDNAHAFFAEPKGIASFNSTRKFIPYTRNGAYLYTTETSDIKLQNDKYKYNKKILKYEEICKNEILIENEDIKLMSETTKAIIKATNLEDLKKDRLNLFRGYNEKYIDINMLNIKINKNDIPFCYPLLVRTEQAAKETARTLEKEGLIIYKYWHNLPDSYTESIFYKRLIPIPLFNYKDI